MSNTKTENADPNTLVIKGARLSYPHLFKPNQVKGSDQKKYSATFVLDKVKDAEQIAAISAFVAKLEKEAFKNVKLAPDKKCWRDGAFKPGTDGFGEGVMFLSSSTSEDRPPRVIDQKKNRLDITDKRVFGGCYVNAVVRLWTQDNDYGKRINASLEAVQYVRTGEPFGAPPVDEQAIFDEIPDEDPVCDLG